jgi:hypothetical protein
MIDWVFLLPVYRHNKMAVQVGLGEANHQIHYICNGAFIFMVVIHKLWRIHNL